MTDPSPTMPAAPRRWQLVLLGWLPALLWAGVIFFGSDTGDPPLGWLADLFPGADKLLHAGEYTLLGLLLCRALLLTTRPTVRWRWIAVAAVLGALYGLTDEWHQGFVPGRHVEALDLFADAAGATLGALLWGLAEPRLAARRRATSPRPPVA